MRATAMGRRGAWARLPAPLHTTDFRVTGHGHQRIETLLQNGCAERGRKFSPYNEKQPEQRIARPLSCFLRPKRQQLLLAWNETRMPKDSGASYPAMIRAQ